MNIILRETAMRKIGILVFTTLLAQGCGSTTGPAAETHFWNEFDWISYVGYHTNFVNVSYAVNNDSLYIMVSQTADTSYYVKCNMPDVVSFDVLYFDYTFSYHRDANRAISSSGVLQTADWYEYYYPYGLGKVTTAESIPLQPDDSLGGINNVEGVYFGVWNGDSTIVYRKPFQTNDSEWDITLEHDSTFSSEIILIWGEIGEPDWYIYNGEEIIPIIL